MLGSGAPGSVGLPLPGVSVRLTQSGEILLKGPNVFPGYWRREDATRDAFADGWFKTGDIATRSEDGYYTLLRPQERPDYFRRLQHLSS